MGLPDPAISGRRVVRVRAPALLVLALLLAASAGCRRKGASDTDSASVAGSTQTESARTQGESNLWNYPAEQWDDPALRKEPRLQFVWRTPDEERESIFTMKLDGTDIRRVAGPSLLYSGEARSLSQKPLRSPNRRYIACVGYDANSDQLRFLVDLKTRTVRTIMKTYGAVHFNWTPDSRYVLFYGDIKLWQYDVETGAVTKLPMIYSKGLYLVDEGRRFVAINDNVIEQYDRSGKMLSRTKLPFDPGEGQAVSTDGRLAAFDLGDHSVVISTSGVNKPMFRGPQTLLFSTFAPDGAAVYFRDDHNELNVIDVTSGKVTQLTRFPGSYIGAMTALASAGRP